MSTAVLEPTKPAKIAGRPQPRMVTVLYTVNGDESHDEKKERVFAVGGLFGSQEEWDLTEAKWVERTGGKIFHAADCESDKGEFEGIGHDENLRLYKDLTTIIAESKLSGRGVAIDIAGSREFFPGIIPESDYHKCFGEILIQFGQLAEVSIPQGKVKFTFDHRIETDYSAASLYRYFTEQPECKLVSYFHDEIAFASRRSPGIQMADLVARETMKELDRRVGPKRREMRKSMAALMSKQYRFVFTYFMREYFESFRNQFKEVVAAVGMPAEEYAAWLGEMVLPDNWVSRIKYASCCDARSRLQNKEGIT